MFDLISGPTRHPFHDATAVPVLASIGGHAVVLALVIGLPLMYATDTLPKVPDMMAFVAQLPAAPPPPPPPAPAVPKGAAKPAAAPSAAPHPSAALFAAPVEAPSSILPEPAYVPSAAYEGGVEGGLEGGVAGGIVGGLMAAPPPPPPPPAPVVVEAKTPVRVGGQLQVPALVRRIEPVYPDVALMAKVSGMVILEALVNEDGSVRSVKVLRSIKLLDNAAIDAVNQWRYSPLVLNGIPTPFVVTVTLNFSFRMDSDR